MPRTSYQMFTAQRANSGQRGIDFLLSYEEWLGIWVASGKLSKRGRGKNKYVMARFGDKGPYAVGNVKIITSSKNLSEGLVGNANALGHKHPPKVLAVMRKKRKGQKPALGKSWKLSESTKAKMSEAKKALLGRKAEGCIMRSGGGKGKGSSYERDVCRKLSLWVSGGVAIDLFWRSAMSGGRATVAHRKGQVVRQAGDITAVRPEGHGLTDRFFIECKHYRKLDIEAFFLTGKGRLAKFWRATVREAKKHKRHPVLIARQNRTEDLILTHPVTISHVMGSLPKERMVRVKHPGFGHCTVWFLDDVLATTFQKDQDAN